MLNRVGFVLATTVAVAFGAEREPPGEGTRLFFGTSATSKYRLTVSWLCFRCTNTSPFSRLFRRSHVGSFFLDGPSLQHGIPACCNNARLGTKHLAWLEYTNGRVLKNDTSAVHSFCKSSFLFWVGGTGAVQFCR